MNATTSNDIIKFEKVKICGKTCYFSESAIDKSLVPEAFNYYEVAGYGTITSNADDFFKGTLLTKDTFALTFVGGFYVCDTNPEEWENSGEFVSLADI